METELSALSSSLLLRGILAVLFGVAAVFWPGITLVVLVYLFSTFILVNGVVDVIGGVNKLTSTGQTVLTKVLRLLFGVLEIGVGVYLLRHVHVSFTALILLIGFTLIVGGVFTVIEGLFEEKGATYRTLTVLIGLVATVAGIIVLFQPRASGVAFVWILGLYSLITGPLLIATAMELHKLPRSTAKR